jgi:hypothetical protein
MHSWKPMASVCIFACNAVQPQRASGAEHFAHWRSASTSSGEDILGGGAAGAGVLHLRLIYLLYKQYNGVTADWIIVSMLLSFQFSMSKKDE